jgi:hypothetical protein
MKTRIRCEIYRHRIIKCYKSYDMYVIYACESRDLAISRGSVGEDGVIISACEKLLCNVSVCVIV